MKTVQQFKEAAQKYFRDADWSDGCAEMVELENAKTWEDLWDAVYSFAVSIGNRKGYGDEGKGSLHTQFIDEISASILIDPNHYFNMC